MLRKIFSTIGTVIVGVIVLGLAAFLCLVLVAFGMDFYKTMRHGEGWVTQGRHGTAIKEFKKEEGNCVYYIDVWGNDTKTCGAYELKLYK